MFTKGIVLKGVLLLKHSGIVLELVGGGWGGEHCWPTDPDRVQKNRSAEGRSYWTNQVNKAERNKGGKVYLLSSVAFCPLSAFTHKTCDI